MPDPQEILCFDRLPYCKSKINKNDVQLNLVTECMILSMVTLLYAVIFESRLRQMSVKRANRDSILE